MSLFDQEWGAGQSSQCGPAEVQPLVLSPKACTCIPRSALASWPEMFHEMVVSAPSEACSKVTVPLTLESPRRTATMKSVSTGLCTRGQQAARHSMYILCRSVLRVCCTLNQWYFGDDEHLDGRRWPVRDSEQMSSLLKQSMNLHQGSHQASELINFVQHTCFDHFCGWLLCIGLEVGVVRPKETVGWYREFGGRVRKKLLAHEMEG